MLVFFCHASIVNLLRFHCSRHLHTFHLALHLHCSRSWNMSDILRYTPLVLRFTCS